MFKTNNKEAHIDQFSAGQKGDWGAFFFFLNNKFQDIKVFTLFFSITVCCTMLQLIDNEKVL